MARNPMGGTDATTTTVGAPNRLPGGAAGVPEAAKPALPAPPSPVGSMAGRGPGPKPKRYRVVNGGSIVQNGCRTPLRAGKEVSNTTYDIAALRRQGIKLEELADEQAPEQVPDETAAKPQT